MARVIVGLADDGLKLGLMIGSNPVKPPQEVARKSPQAS